MHYDIVDRAARMAGRTMEKPMTNLSAAPIFLADGNIPRLRDYPRQGSDIVAGKSGWDIISETINETSNKLHAEGERALTLLAAKIALVKKQSAEMMKKMAQQRVARLEKMLAIPPEEPQKLSKEDAEKVRDFFEKLFKKMGVPSPLGANDKVIILGEDGWSYSFHQDGTVTRRKQGVLTPEEVPERRREAYQLRLDLIPGGVHDMGIEKYQKEFSEYLARLGTLTDEEHFSLSMAQNQKSGEIFPSKHSGVQ